jgi:hypothetical protein
VTEAQALDFMQELAARVDHDLGLGLDAETHRAVAVAVMSTQTGDPDETVQHVYALLMGGLTRH